MFALTCYGWLIFRADSLADIVRFTGRLFTASEPSWAVLQGIGLPVLAHAGPLLLVNAAEASRGRVDEVPEWPRLVRYSVYVAIIYTIVLYGDFEGSDFIYFQF
jgi:hypothetical protein